MHIPVLLHETMTALDPEPGDCIIDGTLGGGGHARAILDRLRGQGTFIGMDWNSDAVRAVKKKFSGIQENGLRLIFETGNFREVQEAAQRSHWPLADGLLLDLGFSSDELEMSGKGFSFRRDEPLLMTYAENAVPARELLRTMNESELAACLTTFGEERFAKRIARAIMQAGKERPIQTSRELSKIIERAVPKGYERGRIHPATRTFQALRIAVNHELENLKQVLSDLSFMAPGGRIVIISFHSLEDRIVKLRFRELAKEGKGMVLTKKPILPSPDNPVYATGNY